MKVREFMQVLEAHSGKELKFEYTDKQFVGAHYHLTEVKNVQFDTTDCGGKTNHWLETQMQLWENPKEEGKERFMTTDKILSILKRVDGIKPLLRDTEVKFEYGNANFHTSVMPVHEVRTNEGFVEVVLFEEKTRCKAMDPVWDGLAEKETAAAGCCAPASGCC